MTRLPFTRKASGTGPREYIGRRCRRSDGRKYRTHACYGSMA
jgi:hypothetical protein